MVRPEVVAALDASFDAGLVINEESGEILHANEAARELFMLEETSDLGSVNSHLSFLRKDVQNDSKNTQEWEEVMNLVRSGDEKVPDWKATGKFKDGTEFPAHVKMTRISGLENEEMHNVILFIRLEPNPNSASNEDARGKKAESITEAVIEASLDPMFQIDEHGNIHMVNKAAILQFGWSKEELMGSNISIIAGGKHAENHDKYIQAFIKTGISKVIGKKRELPARRKDGSELPIELGICEVETSFGEKRMFCGYVQNLENRKKAEDEVRRRTSITEAVVEASLDPVFQINEHGIIQMTNKAATLLFGWSKDEFLGSNISIIAGGKHAENHDGYIQAFIKTGVSKVIGKKRELPARRKDGRQFPIELGVCEVETSIGDERMFCGYVHDLTKQKKNENELVRREKLTAGVIEASLDPMFQIDERGIIRMVNNAAVRQFGWSKQEFLGSNISIIAGSKHSSKHDGYIQQYLKTGVSKVIGKKRELPAKRKDGSEFVIELGVSEVQVSNGDDRMFCGYVHDLTNRKKAENEIKRREEFTNRIIESSYDALFVIDTHGDIARVNSAVTSMFGWKREELHEKNLAGMFPEEVATEFMDEIEQFALIGMPLTPEREVHAMKKDGSTFPVMTRVSELEGPNESNCFAVFVADLTDKKKLMEIEIEKAAAEFLLLNVLPEQIALRLRDDPSNSIAESHECATILFADIVGFTSMSSRMDPEEVVAMLNHLFTAFDELVEKYDLNKIKTVGDCYMVTSVPAVTHEEHECIRVCHFALDMLQAIDDYNVQYPTHKLSLRVGIHAGPVVAGVVGTKRFLYDLWGDAVNLASRMESTGIPGKIQVTKEVVELCGDVFRFASRGLVPVKGKGDVETFLILKRQRQPSLRVKASRPREDSVDSAASILKEFKSSMMMGKSLRDVLGTFQQRMVDESMSNLEVSLSPPRAHGGGAQDS